MNNKIINLNKLKIYYTYDNILPTRKYRKESGENK